MSSSSDGRLETALRWKNPRRGATRRRATRRRATRRKGRQGEGRARFQISCDRVGPRARPSQGEVGVKPLGAGGKEDPAAETKYVLMPYVRDADASEGRRRL